METGAVHPTFVKIELIVESGICRELTDYMKEQINKTLTELRKGQQVTVVYYGTMEQETLQITGTVMKVDPYWQTLQVNKLVIDFSEIYEIIQ